MAPPLRVFICYAHADNELREALYKHLLPLKRNGLFEPWDDRQLAVGDTWETRLSEELEQADMVLALVSPDFIASEYAFGKELTRALALARAKEGTTKVVPIIVRDCLWRAVPHLAALEAPRKGKAPKNAGDDRAWTEIAEALRAEGLEMRKRRETRPKDRGDDQRNQASTALQANEAEDLGNARLVHRPSIGKEVHGELPGRGAEESKSNGEGRELLIGTQAPEGLHARRPRLKSATSMLAMVAIAVAFLMAMRAMGAANVASLMSMPRLSERIASMPLSCPNSMIRVEGAAFKMGTTEFPDEQPVHEQAVRTFCLDRTEVTAKAYGDCVAAKACSDTPTKSAGSSCTGANSTLARHPINCVTWSEAVTYCAWANWGRGRLPTEAEWEFAARGVEGRRYPWGKTEPTENMRGQRLLNACGGECPDRRMYEMNDGFAVTAPVGSFRDGDTPPQGGSQEGFRDLAGNVWEWVNDLYCESYEAKNCTDYRVIRGGSWFESSPVNVRGALRFKSMASSRVNSIGFRCALDYPQSIVLRP